MADLREVFPILADSAASGAGYDVTRAYEGFAASGVEGAVPSLVAKDSSGNLIFLQLDSQGRLPVTSVAGTPKSARGIKSGGSAAMADVTGSALTLTSTKVYTNIQCIVSCFRETVAKLVWNNNGAEVILADIIVGPGSYTYDFDLLNAEITAGAGTQEIKVVAMNLDKLSDIRASVTCLELI